MKIERHETGPRMSKVVIHGDTVYLAGIVAGSPKGSRPEAFCRRSIASWPRPGPCLGVPGQYASAGDR
jgi:hypothetical protein